MTTVRVIICWFNICYYGGSCGSLQKLLILDWNGTSFSAAVAWSVWSNSVMFWKTVKTSMWDHISKGKPKKKNRRKKKGGGVVGVERWVCPVEVGTAFRSSIFQRSRRGKEEKSEHGGGGGGYFKKITTATMNYTLNSGSVFCHIRHKKLDWIRAVFCGTQEKRLDLSWSFMGQKKIDFHLRHLSV